MTYNNTDEIQAILPPLRNDLEVLKYETSGTISIEIIERGTKMPRLVLVFDKKLDKLAYYYLQSDGGHYGKTNQEHIAEIIKGIGWLK